MFRTRHAARPAPGHWASHAFRNTTAPMTIEQKACRYINATGWRKQEMRN
jgi:hypothetical protein